MILTLLLSLNFSSDFSSSISGKEIVGVYRGITDDFLFSFETEGGKMFFFDDVDYDVEVNLYNKENIGKKYKVVWTEEKLEIEEGLEDESAIMVKVILELEELE